MTNVAIYSWGQNGYYLWILISLAVVYGRLKNVDRTLAPVARTQAPASSNTKLELHRQLQSQAGAWERKNVQEEIISKPAGEELT